MLNMIPVHGWAGAYHGHSYVVRATNEEDCHKIVTQARTQGLSIGPLGGAQSFGDSIVNTKQILLDCRLMNKVLSWDSVNGVATLEAGVSMSKLLREFIPLGWLPSSIPGSIAVTVGGAVANNVHGKDSIIMGNFGRHVKWLDLMLADGSVTRVSPTDQAELFRATIGGIGLTGIILRVGLQLHRIPSATVLTKVRMSQSIEETFANLADAGDCDYAQVWLDAYPQGEKLGRGITMMAKFIEDDTRISIEAIESSLAEKTKMLGIIPSQLFWRTTRHCFYPPIMPIVNWVYWNKARLAAGKVEAWETMSFSSYYFFHNNIPDFYSVYRPPGFLEIQALLPSPAGALEFRKLLTIAKKAGVTPVLSGMKKSIADDFYISFQGNGQTISFDFPIAGHGLAKLERTIRPLYEQIADFGGVIGLSKDQVMPRDIFQRCYPKWQKFWQIKNTVDPSHMFCNDMGRRLFPFD